jgi:putative addiction module CopG family antidote
MSQVSKSCTLPDELIKFAEAEVRDGRYGSVDEVIQTALQRLRQHDILIDDDDAPELLAALEPALEDIRQGRYEEGSAKELMARVRSEVGL